MKKDGKGKKLNIGWSETGTERAPGRSAKVRRGILDAKGKRTAHRAYLPAA